MVSIPELITEPRGRRALTGRTLVIRRWTEKAGVVCGVGGGVCGVGVGVVCAVWCVRGGVCGVVLWRAVEDGISPAELLWGQK